MRGAQNTRMGQRPRAGAGAQQREQRATLSHSHRGGDAAGIIRRGSHIFRSVDSSHPASFHHQHDDAYEIQGDRRRATMLRCVAGSARRPRPFKPPSFSANAGGGASSSYCSSVVLSGGLDERRKRQRQRPPLKGLNGTTRLYVWLLDGPAGAERLRRRRPPPLSCSSSIGALGAGAAAGGAPASGGATLVGGSTGSRGRWLPPTHSPTSLSLSSSSSAPEPGKGQDDRQGAASPTKAADPAGGGAGAGGPASPAEKSEHVVKLALGGNVIITLAKFLAWLHSGSRYVRCLDACTPCVPCLLGAGSVRCAG